MNKLLRFASRDSALVPLVAILMGLVIGAIVMLIGGYNPLTAYWALLTKVFGNAYDFGEAIVGITPLIMTGLAVGFAFRAGLFNIGGEGQFIAGATGAAFIGVKLNGLPWIVHAPLAVVVGAILGGLWGAIAGYLKAKRGVNEVITTIMLNFTALNLANYLIKKFIEQKGQSRSLPVQESASLSMPRLSEWFDNARLHWGVFIAIAAAMVFYVLLWKTKQGYELRAVGHNANAAHYAGMNVNRNVVKAMFISGMFAGLAGVFEVLGVFHYQVIAAASPGYGFDGIAVALLGMNHPLGVVLAACLFGVLNYGSVGMSFVADVPPEIIRVVIGSVIFFVAAQGIVRYVIAPMRKRGRGAANGNS
ncbi:ABC transporter permease [Paenibacillus koleovorans]|uniref:ABC transporter permease n=1 Tax=Paenibacillus koleovorans TaxID=121608 RepID=UPI000FDA4E4C|nr:ABC transporter permease [Paenibacillus koleovorans]